MTRLGWAILALIVAAAAGFASLVRVGPGGERGGALRIAAVRPIPPAPPRPDRVRRDLLTVPVPGTPRASLVDSWGDPRGGGTRGHHGTDLPAAAGTPVVAAGPGRIEKLFTSVAGGTTLYERSRDGRWMYYYAHLAGYAPGVAEGQVVRAGAPLGFVGDTGDAGAGNFHLHFGLSRMVPGARWWEGEEVDPFPLLAGRPARR